MQRLFLFSTCFLAFVCAEVTTSAQTTVDALGQARLVTDGGTRDDNNGGNTTSGALIGVNAGGVDNFLIFDFSDLSGAAGQTVTGATLDFNVATGFSAGNHGSDADLINISEIAIGNSGWLRGGDEITGGDNQADDGSVSFLNRVQHTVASGTSEAWVDSSGDVANLLGALTTLSSQNAYNVGEAPAVLSFSVDAATAQRWVDSGLGGLALSVTDNGDGNGRFNFIGNGLSNAGSITFLSAVPEPSSAALLAVFGMIGLVRRKRA